MNDDADDLNETLRMIARCHRYQWSWFYSEDCVPLPPLVPEFDKQPNAATYFTDVA